MCSMWSGKADVYDSLIMIGKTTDFSKVHIYADGNPIELRIDSYKDLIPYFPCIPSIETYSDGEYRIYTSSTPYYRKEELSLLKIYVRDLITCYNKLKREKKYTIDNLVIMYKNKYKWSSISDKLICQLANKVDEAKGHKERINLNDVFTPQGDYFREKLYKEMVENGWDEFKAKEWCCGYERAWNEKRESN